MFKAYSILFTKIDSKLIIINIHSPTCDRAYGRTSNSYIRKLIMEDRDMTYSELVGLFDKLIDLGVLHEDDVVMRFV